MNSLKQMITSIDLNKLLSIFDIQIAIAVLLFFIAFKSIFSKLIISLCFKITKNKKDAKDSVMYKPLNVFFVLLGIFLMINILPANKQFLHYMNQIFLLIVIFYITKFITTLIYPDTFLMKKLQKANTSDKAINKFVCAIIRGAIWTIAFIIGLYQIGIDITKFNGLVTGLGIGSAAIALAAQDMVKSMLSGAAILSDKPFVIGDWIEVGDYQGTVIDITFRSTRIKSYNNAVITIPNSTITSAYVVNWNRLTSRRFDAVINISLETPVEKLRKIVKEFKFVLQNDPNVIKETVEVNITEIANSSTDIKIFLYVREANYSKFLKAKEDILCELLEVVEKENVDLAYPTQTLYVKKGDIEE